MNWFIVVLLCIVFTAQTAQARFNPFQDWTEAAPEQMDSVDPFKGVGGYNDNPVVKGLMGAYAGNQGKKDSGTSVISAMEGMVGGNAQDTSYLRMAQQLYTLYQMNPDLIGTALQGFLGNWKDKV